MVVYQDGCCDEVEKVLAAVEKVALEKGYISGQLVITRGIHCESGTSGDTHCPGAAADIWITNIENATELVRLLRNAGCAAFIRPKLVRNGEVIWQWHIHLVLVNDSALTNGRRHDAGGAYQVRALNDGYNGLGNGYQAKDDGPRAGVQWPLRTWQQGIVWLQTQGDELMTDAQYNALMKRIGGRDDDPSLARRLIDLEKHVAHLESEAGVRHGAKGVVLGERLDQKVDRLVEGQRTILDAIAADSGTSPELAATAKEIADAIRKAERDALNEQYPEE